MEAHELRPMPGNNSCQGQPPARKLVRYLREDQVRKKGHQVLDRIKALYSPRTQAYGETNYLKEKSKSFGQNQGLVWSSDSSLWGNQGLVWSSDSSLWGNQLLKKKKYKFWTEPRPCMVLGLKPMGKPTT